MRDFLAYVLSFILPAIVSFIGLIIVFLIWRNDISEFGAVIIFFIFYGISWVICLLLIEEFMNAMNKKETDEEQKYNTESLLNEFNRILKGNNGFISNNEYFLNFMIKYSKEFDYIDSSVSAVREGNYNIEFEDNDFIQFLSILMQGSYREHQIQLKDYNTKLVNKLKKLIFDDNKIIYNINLENWILITVFSNKFKKFQEMYGKEDVIFSYFRKNKHNYKNEDLAFIYLLKYGHESEKTFSDVARELEKLSDESDLLDFKRDLLSDKKNVVSIEDIDNMNGNSFEKFISNLFIKQGYQTEITVSIGDQGVDIIASNFNDKIAIQAKCHSNPIGNKAVQEVIAGAQYYECNKSMVITNSIFTKSAKDLAAKSNVTLVDRSELENMINKYYNHI